MFIHSCQIMQFLEQIVQIAPTFFALYIYAFMDIFTPIKVQMANINTTVVFQSNVAQLLFNHYQPYVSSYMTILDFDILISIGMQCKSRILLFIRLFNTECNQFSMAQTPPLKENPKPAIYGALQLHTKYLIHLSYF